MRWSDAVAAVDTVQVAGRGDISISGVQYDSRRISPGDVFVAMRGGMTDGNRFIDQAIHSGAAAVITDSAEHYASLCSQQPELALAVVEHGRRALAEISSELFGHPERRLRLSAVTGTNGKTTTAYLLEQMLERVGRRCVLLGTIESRIAGKVIPSDHTTPESRDILALFAEGVQCGCNEAVMEMSSHALDQERVWGLPIDAAIFTNLTPDHLDYHETMERYFAAKCRLFEGVGTEPPKAAVINVDDPWGLRLSKDIASCSTSLLYGIKSERALYRAKDVQLRAGETRLQWLTPGGSATVRTPLTGRVNIYNWLAASCAALSLGLSMTEIVEASAQLRQVPGRFEVVAGSQTAGFTVVVDFAHTEDALDNLIALARDLAGGGRVLTLFGCGGDRDRSKRPKMGRVAADGSDLVILTSDNPRSERPENILNEVMVGVRQTQTPCVVEVDRSRAIELAIKAARPGDILLIAGKGHEKTQTFADRTVPFNDVEEAERLLKLRIGDV